MKNFSSIAAKYLKVQKKRTILTLIGIILSVALITGTGTVLTSMWDKFYRDGVASSGDYYAKFTSITPAQSDIVTRHTGVEKTAVTRDLGYAAIAQNKEKAVPKNKFLSVKAYDASAFSMLNVKLLEGRLPQNGAEIVLEKRGAKYMPDVRVGGQVTLQIGDRKTADGQKLSENEFSEDEVLAARETKTYTVVGLAERANSYSQNIFYGMTGFEASADATQTVYVKLSSQINVRPAMQKIAQDAGITGERKLVFNEDVLRYMIQSGSDTLNGTFILLALIIISIITAATVAVIYNAFNISVLERVSQFGLFRCIGATPRQIRGVVIREAMTLAAFGIPIGLVCGTLAISLVFEIFKAISSADMVFGDLRIVLSLWIIVPSALLGLATIYISAAGPARKAARVSPMEAVRNIGEYKKEKIRKRQSKTGRKLLGVYGFVSWRNLSRNKKRVRITVLSMVISIALYIFVSSFLDLSLMSGAVSPNEYANFQVYTTDDSDAAFTASEKNDLMQMKDVEQIYTVRECNITTALPEARLNQERIKLIKERTSEENGLITLPLNRLETLGDAALPVLQKYLKEGSADAGRLNSEKGVLIVKTVGVNVIGDKKYIFDLADVKTGDTLEIGIEGLPGFTEKLKVLGVLSQNVLSTNYNEFPGFTMVTTDGVYDGVVKDANEAIEKMPSQEDAENLKGGVFTPAKTWVKMKDKSDTAQAKSYLMNLVEQHPDWELNDFDEWAKNQQSSTLVICILFYGFITVIALIGALNIINTISTNILLRTRELSVLKAVGMTRRGLGLLVYLESIYYSILAALYGGLAGTALSWLLFKTGSMARDMAWTVPWNHIFIALAGASVICLVSGYVPLKRINNGVIIENIRKEQ